MKNDMKCEEDFRCQEIEELRTTEENEIEVDKRVNEIITRTNFRFHKWMRQIRDPLGILRTKVSSSMTIS